MTRRGTLAYYLTAIVVGCFFLVLGVTAIGEGSLRFSTAGLRDFFLLYFLALVYGSFTMLLFAFLLRRMAHWLKWEPRWGRRWCGRFSCCGAGCCRNGRWWARR